jgi:hypothetical protein
MALVCRQCRVRTLLTTAADALDDDTGDLAAPLIAARAVLGVPRIRSAVSTAARFTATACSNGSSASGIA